MLNLNYVNKKLRYANRKNYVLYLVCNFVSLLLITAYSSIMFSPTVLTVLPEGGDSRKQMVAIFVLACVGCVVFTIYAASLFYRMKSKEIGTMMALGASKKRLEPALLREVGLLSGSAALAGAVCGIPFAWLIWQGFRLFIVDSKEMELHFDLICLVVPAVFLLLVLFCAFLLGVRFLNRTNIMDVVHEEHKNEPIREVSHICGPLGFVLLLAGAVIGYYAPMFYMNWFSAYPPAWINVFYMPVFIGLYMVLLHTVIHGLGRSKKRPYKNIISRSMMKFQGKQTVNNMLVVTVLTAGACFAMFYTPMLATGQILATNNRAFDYFYAYRGDQKLPDQEEVTNLAKEYGIQVTDWKEASYASLAMDGEEEVEDENNKFHDEYKELLGEARFLSATAFASVTGGEVSVPRGSYYAVSDQGEEGSYRLNRNITVVTNMVNNNKLPVQFGGILHDTMLTGELVYYVLNDSDYKEVTSGLTDDWMGGLVFFNHGAGKDSYSFAVRLFHTIVASSGPECEITTMYDRVAKSRIEKEGGAYWADSDPAAKLSYKDLDSSDFRLWWAYMPKFRVLDQNDFLRNMAVYLMMFLFISIVCIMASLIICYTRCMTIALNNQFVFEDLKRLGASPKYLNKEVKNQSSKVFLLPSAIAMGLMYLLYSMIMFANDGKLSSQEFAGLSVCLVLIVVLLALIWLVYRYTVQKMKKTLNL